MVLFFRVLTRLFVLAFAYILATLAGLATIAAAIWGWQVNYTDFASQTPEQDIIITLAAGFVAGFTYWLIAGRSAGNWRNQVKL